MCCTTNYVDSSNQIPNEIQYNIPEIDNHLHNIALHPFYADIIDIDEYNMEQSELIMMPHNISAKHEFEKKVLGFFKI